MFVKMHEIFADKTGGDVFVCYGPWHIFYICLMFALIVGGILIFNKKSQDVKEKFLKTLVGIGFGLYMADFFLMPFAYMEIDVDKLPFHACTSMCVLSFASNHSNRLKKYRVHFAMIAFISNIIYIAYPSGVMAYEISPLSYRAVQTLLFHCVMTSYGILVLVLDKDGPQIKYWYRDLIILTSLTLWAMVGNALYSGTLEEYSRDFNWFFIKQDPLYIFSENIARYICPWLNVVVFFITQILIYLVFKIINNSKQKAKKSKETILA